MSIVSSNDRQARVGTDFIAALTIRNFGRIQACFHSEVKFRALVPSTLREGSSPAEATTWFRRWFEESDELKVLDSSVERIADWWHIAYRIRVRTKLDWELVEQHAYYIVQDGLISAMNLVCSGFHPDPETQHKQEQSAWGADAYYDAGARGCAEGPLDEIAQLMRGLASGQTLEVRATDPSVLKDLPAWCRMVEHQIVNHEGSRYLIRHK